MKHSIAITLITFFTISFNVKSIFSQNIITSSGGNAFGLGGSSSYTIGQIKLNNNSSNAGSVNQGVQTPFELNSLNSLSVDFEKVVSIFPNPSTQYLIFKLINQNNLYTNCEIYNIHGKFLDRILLNQFNTVLNFNKYPKGAYILKIQKNNEIIQSSKIIKL